MRNTYKDCAKEKGKFDKDCLNMKLKMQELEQQIVLGEAA